MEEKKYKILKIMLIILIIIVIILSGYIIYEKVLNKKIEDNEINIVEKIDKNKDYVYDAEYESNINVKEFNRPYSTNIGNDKKTINYYGIDVSYNDGTQYLKDLIVPYININSKAANEVNKELKLKYEKNTLKFEECSKDKNVGCSQILTYRTFKYNNILSVVVIESFQTTAHWVLEYSIYNFDLNTGSILEYPEFLERLGYPSNISSKVKEQIKNKMNELYLEYVNNLETACQNKNCYDIAYKMYDDEVSNNENLFFIDNNGILNLLVIPYYNGVENGDTQRYLIKIEK